MSSDQGTLIGFVKVARKKEGSTGWLLLARNQSKLYRTTIRRVWTSSSVYDIVERENTKQIFMFKFPPQSLCRDAIKTPSKRI
jgi:hypothetical protein